MVKQQYAKGTNSYLETHYTSGINVPTTGIDLVW